MPPNNQHPGQNQYEFIMNPSPKQRHSFNFGHNKGARITVVVVGIIILSIVATFINGFLGKENKAQTDQLVEIAQAQSEIIRISAIAKEKARSNGTKNFAANTKVSIETSQQDVRKLLNSRGVKDKALNKKLSASKNSKTDATLDQAANNNRFDETFQTVVTKQLSDYQKLIQSASVGGTPNEKKALAKALENSKLLVAQGDPTQSSQP
jgi:hypothetical protein